MRFYRVLQSVLWTEIWKIAEFFIWKFSFFGGEIFYIFELEIKVLKFKDKCDMKLWCHNVVHYIMSSYSNVSCSCSQELIIYPNVSGLYAVLSFLETHYEMNTLQ